MANDYKINVVSISETWPCSRHKFCVAVGDFPINKYNYILETLAKWFGSAEYFWNGTFLCGTK